jgi:hypothetical protein
MFVCAINELYCVLMMSYTQEPFFYIKIKKGKRIRRLERIALPGENTGQNRRFLSQENCCWLFVLIVHAEGAR